MPKTCPGCGAENKIQAPTCERCTRSFLDPVVDPWLIRYRWHLVLGGLAVIALWGWFAGNVGGGDDDRYAAAETACQAELMRQRPADTAVVTRQGENNQDTIITFGLVGVEDEFTCWTTTEDVTTVTTYKADP